jgi:thioredoxin reductase (NADPH)
METLLAFFIAGAVTLFFVRHYLRDLTAPKAPRSVVAKPPDLAMPKRPCPRCARPVEQGSAFCQFCGAALVMWTVHSARTASATPTAGKTGRAKPVINASLCIGCGSCVHECPETGTLEMNAGKAILTHPERCTGHAKCAEVCPTQAITLSYDGVLQTMRVPVVKENFETNVPGVFIVGELCGMGLIKTAINEGKIVINHLRNRIRQTPDASCDDLYDVAIVGAGPAGLSASLTALQYGLRYITLEQGEIASTIRNYPRQKFLMAEPLEIPLYGALYVGDGTKEALLAVWETIISNTGVAIRTNEKVESVQRNSAGFHVQTPKGDYHARYVVLALGKRGSPRKLGVPGEDLPKVSYRIMEAESYEGKDLLVVGGGDSAIEAALALSRSGTNRVTICYRGDSFHLARERNRAQIDQARDDGRVRLLLNSHIQRITPEDVVVRTGERESVSKNDYVFVLIGGESPDEFLQKIGVEIVEKAWTTPAVA